MTEFHDHEEERAQPSEEQWQQTKTSDEKKLDIETGIAEEDVYSEEGREEMTENDELSPAEEGFMEGAEGRGQLAKCDECGKILGQDKEDIVEREFDGELFFFCSERCAEEFARKRT